VYRNITKVYLEINRQVIQ